MPPAVSESPSWSRRSWIKHFMLGSAVAMGSGMSWRSSILADIAPNTPATDIIPIDLTQFSGLMDGSTPSIQLQLSAYDQVIMINRAPFNGLFYVLDSKCTHQGCIVNKWDINANILCPCHGSNYNIDGSLIFGAAGPMQPPLNAYNFNYDGANLLQIQVPGLNLKINSLTVQSSTASSKRLHLAFPAYAGASYQVAYSTDMINWTAPINFALTATGATSETVITAADSTPLEVWVDDTNPKGFYRVEVLLMDY